MAIGGGSMLVALLSVGVSAAVLPIMLVLFGVGFVLFVVSAALHDRVSERPPSTDGFPHITDLDL